MSAERDIEVRWAWIVNHEDPIVRHVAQLASGYPVLRRLFPFASLQNLWFSRKTSHPYDYDLPHIRYEFGRFHAIGSDRAVLLVGAAEDVVSCVASAVKTVLSGDC